MVYEFPISITISNVSNTLNFILFYFIFFTKTLSHTYISWKEENLSCYLPTLDKTLSCSVANFSFFPFSPFLPHRPPQSKARNPTNEFSTFESSHRTALSTGSREFVKFPFQLIRVNVRILAATDKTHPTTLDSWASPFLR
jgi:hypothetical protein